MAVLDPVKLTVVNYPEDKTEEMETEVLPGDDTSKSRITSYNVCYTKLLRKCRYSLAGRAMLS